MNKLLTSKFSSRNCFVHQDNVIEKKYSSLFALHINYLIVQQLYNRFIKFINILLQLNKLFRKASYVKICNVLFKMIIEHVRTSLNIVKSLFLLSYKMIVSKRDKVFNLRTKN